jgi:hypothetical protein
MNHDSSEVAAALDQLDQLVHNAKAVPLTNQVRIDREEFYEIFDRLRAALALANET